MSTTMQENVVHQKTRELCQAILDQPEYKSIRQQMESFMTNEEARGLYENLTEKGEYLHHKQHQGISLTDSEIEGYEKDRTAFMNNPVARNFMNAQEQLRKLQETINQFVGKTFELGRVPSQDDLQSSGGCGHGCGCHH